jgi:5-methylcytosine-specific restriction endonuclease McrA
MQGCLILNGDYTYLTIISWKKAIKLVYKGKATVLKYSEHVVKTAENVIMKIPAVAKLVHIIRTIYRTKVPFSKKNVMTRDNFICQYCGSAEELTVDHVVPLAKGGKTEFENCVTACKICNSKKGHKLPSEAGVYPKRRPTAPTISEFVRIRAQKAGVLDLLRELGVY